MYQIEKRTCEEVISKELAIILEGTETVYRGEISEADWDDYKGVWEVSVNVKGGWEYVEVTQ